MKVVTIGLGYIGLPTSALIASKKFRVLGVDTNAEVVKKINKGETHIVEPKLGDLVKDTVRDGYFKAAQIPEEGDVYLIVVPTRLCLPRLCDSRLTKIMGGVMNLTGLQNGLWANVRKKLES